MIMRKLMSIVLLQCIFITASFAQKEVTGKVVDSATGEPLSNVSVITNKKKSGTSTGVDGSFKLATDSKTSIIIFSSVGYGTVTYDIKSVPSIVRLVKSASALDEVVVIGYGTQRKSHLTGAISKYQNEKLDESPVSRLDQALQGKIAGVEIQNLTSEAGADPKIRIRGQTSINAVSDPLVVVDGHPVDGLSFVNMADVQSVEVLKDAASAAIYGSRAAGGVIIITTKSGKAERPKYSVKVSNGAKTAYKTYDVLTSTEYANLLFYEASLRAKDPSWTGNTNLITNNERAAYVIENTLMGGKATDWQEVALRNADTRNVQLNVSGGKKDIRYYLSGGYQKDQGLMYHSEYDKFNLRGRLDVDLSKRVKIGFNINPSYIRREQPTEKYVNFVRFYSFLPVYHTATTAAFVNQSAQWANVKPGDFAQARHFNGRAYNGYMPDGSFWSTTASVDPFSTALNSPKSINDNTSDKTNNYRVLSSGDITINILKGLDFKSSASVYISYIDRLKYNKKGATSEGSNNRGIFKDSTFIDLLSENTLTYSKKIGNHNFDLLAGFTTQRSSIKSKQVTATDFPSDNIPALNTALTIIQSKAYDEGTYDYKTAIGLNSVLGRLNYSYKDRYLLSASFRRDGSSYFGDGHKWGSFPALSIGWAVSQEKFMENVKWISNLKLRSSYGATGNNRIVEFAYIDLLYSANYPFGSGTGTSASGQIPSQLILANPDITWERTFQYNTGLDLGLFRNRISLSVDVYQSKTEKLLLKQTTLGFTGNINYWANVGQLRNRGIELEITTNNIRTKNIKWTTTANISHTENKLVDNGGTPFPITTGEREDGYINALGAPLVQFYGYKTDGIFTSQAQADSFKNAGYTSTLSTTYFAAGGLKLVDINGDKIINDKDRTVIGNPYPDFTWGLNNSFNFGPLDISFLLQGSQGGELINGDAGYNETKRTNKSFLANRWISPANPGNGKTPYSTNGGISWVATDYMVEDASYYTLRELIIGYTLPAKLTSAIHLTSARFYFSGQNLYFHFAKTYKGINPEARMTSGVYDSPLKDGYQRGGFPIPKTILFGLDINF